MNEFRVYGSGGHLGRETVLFKYMIISALLLRYTLVSAPASLRQSYNIIEKDVKLFCPIRQICSRCESCFQIEAVTSHKDKSDFFLNQLSMVNQNVLVKQQLNTM